MKPKTYAEEGERIDTFKELLRQAGIAFDDWSLLVHWADPTSKDHPEGYLSVHFEGETLSFEDLEKASKLLGTRKIDIGCEHGCSSDPCHESLITIYGAQGL